MNKLENLDKTRNLTKSLTKMSLEKLALGSISLKSEESNLRVIDHRMSVFRLIYVNFTNYIYEHLLTSLTNMYM